MSAILKSASTPINAQPRACPSAFSVFDGNFDKNARERDGRDASGANTKLVSFLFYFFFKAPSY